MTKDFVLAPAPGKLKEERPPQGVYSRLISAFVEEAKVGEQVVVLNPDKTPLSKEESRRVYQGLKQSVRYQAAKGNPWPVDVHSQNGEVIIVRVEDPPKGVV